MNNALSFQRVGYPNYGLVYEIFQRNAADPEISREFEQSFSDFMTPHMARSRVLHMYEAKVPERIGELVYCKEGGLNPVGFGWLGLTEDSIASQDKLRGVNLSLFIEKTYRRMGIGTELAEKLIKDYHDADDRFEHWRDRTLWTGARRNNIPSIRMLGSLGFKEAGTLDRLPEYEVFTY